MKQAAFSRVLQAFYLQATASRPRRLFFFTLLVWAFVDACWSAKPALSDAFASEMPATLVAVAAALFFMSFGWSLVFVGMSILLWDWLARVLHSARRQR